MFENSQHAQSPGLLPSGRPNFSLKSARIPAKGEAQGDIDGRHDRDDAGGDGADAAYAAEDAQAGEQGQRRPHHRGPDALGVAGQIVLEGGAGVVGLEGVEAVGEAGDEQHREHHAEEPAAQGLLDVVGRAAHPVVPVLLLVALGQGALNEGGGRADEGQQPHPEHRAVAADDRGGDDGVGHPGDVAGAHPGGGGDHQGLEGGSGQGLASVTRPIAGPEASTV